MSEWQPYGTAPKDGSIVELRSDEEGPFSMYWDAKYENPRAGKLLGLWVLVGGGLTWSDYHPDGAPTEWRWP